MKRLLSFLIGVIPVLIIIMVATAIGIHLYNVYKIVGYFPILTLFGLLSYSLGAIAMLIATKLDKRFKKQKATATSQQEHNR